MQGAADFWVGGVVESPLGKRSIGASIAYWAHPWWSRMFRVRPRLEGLEITPLRLFGSGVRPVVLCKIDLSSPVAIESGAA